MNICICICRPLLARSLIVILAAVLALAPVAWGGGTVTNATPADLQAALNGGGTVTFGVGGVITLTNTIIIAQDTVLDAAGFDVTISGGNAVRLFQVNSNVAFSAKGLTLANGSFIGANGSSASPGFPGQDGSGAGILNLGGTVALTGCALTNHSAQGGNGGMPTLMEGFSAGGDGSGAAICNQRGTVNLTNCILAGNSALGGAPFVGMLSGAYAIPGQALGAAISCADGQLNLQGVNCSANNVRGGPGMGGAIYATNSTVVMANSQLSGNSAFGSLAEGLGGALFLSSDSTALVELCSFTANAANGGQLGGYLEPYSGASAFGGAVYSGGSLQIMDSTFASNACYGAFGTPPGVAQGGAVASINRLVLNGCTFDHNSVIGGGNGCAELRGAGAPAEGGGVWTSGVLAATNSTFTANQATGGAGSNPMGVGPPGTGGPASGGALCVAAGSATLVNLTIAANGATGTAGECDGVAGQAQGGGLYNTSGVVTVINSIIADSLSGGDVWGVLTDGGYNICSDGTAGFSGPLSQDSTNPLLGPLADNGGPTETIALLPGSPALDAIPFGFPRVDQRGVTRPQGSWADIGAFEALAAGGPFIGSQPEGASVRTGANVTFTVLATAAAPLAYQWFDDGTAIVGATNSSLSLTNIQPASAGAYWVDLTAAGVETNSQTAFLIVDSVPLIVSWPTSLVVSVGGKASFTVLAEGPSLAYQWWHNDALISGATNPTLVIESAQAGAQGAYSVEVSNFAASVLSPPGLQLTFDASGLAILASPPPSVSASIWDVLTLSVTAAGVAPIAYQWGSNGTNIPGATNSALTFMMPATEPHSYSVQVTNGYGDVTIAVTLLPRYDYTWSTIAESQTLFALIQGLALDGSGNLFVAADEGPTVLKVTPAGVIRTLPVDFEEPDGVAVDTAGNLYVADAGRSIIVKIDPAGVATTLAGSPGMSGSLDGRASQALFNAPVALAVDRLGNVYVADLHNQTIRKITPDGTVSTLAGSPGLAAKADGEGSAARFNGPVGVAVDAAQNVYVVEDFNEDVRKVTPAGVVTTLAGGPPGEGGSADGLGSAARFNNPQGIAVDAVGNVYVADFGNETIRKITPAGWVTTLAGSPDQAGTALGDSSMVRFRDPTGLAVDAQGIVYVADRDNQRILKGVPPTVSNLVAGAYAMVSVTGQSISLDAAALLAACTAPEGDLLAVSAVSPTTAQGGVVQLAGSTITYTPATGFVGTDSFTYTVFDSRGASTQGTVTVTVLAVSMAPTLGLTLPLPNSVVIRFAGLPGTTYNVEVSTDLVHWTQIGAATAVTNGWFQFIDSETNLSSARFYRTRVP